MKMTILGLSFLNWVCYNGMRNFLRVHIPFYDLVETPVKAGALEVNPYGK